MKKLTYYDPEKQLKEEWENIKRSAEDLHAAVTDFAESYSIIDEDSLNYLLSALKEVVSLELEKVEE